MQMKQQARWFIKLLKLKVKLQKYNEEEMPF